MPYKSEAQRKAVWANKDKAAAKKKTKVKNKNKK